jgi:uncharacterized protein (DUF697 family)
MTTTQEKSIMPIVLRYGLLGGLGMIGFNVLNYITLFATSNIGGAISGFVIQLAIWFGMVALAIRHHRDQDLGGFITMGKCLSLGILVIMLAALVSGIFGYIYMNFIDTEVLVKQTKSMAWIYEMMGMDEDMIEQAQEAVEETQATSNVLYAIGGALVGGAITGLIVSAITGAIMRKNPPEMA